MKLYVIVTFLAAIIFLVCVVVALITEIVECVQTSRNDELGELRSENVELREENERLKGKIVAHVFPSQDFAKERKNKCADDSVENKAQFCYGETKEDDDAPLL